MIVFNQEHMYVEACSVASLAERFGTPVYVYSKAQLLANCRSYTDIQSACPHTSYYAVKANSNLQLLRVIGGAGLGFDVVSGGELERCLAIGANPNTIVYSGVGKSTAELNQAMQAGIGCINIESEGEAERIMQLVVRNMPSIPVRVAIRVNPDIPVATHPYISTSLASNKFGVPFAQVPSLAARIARAPGCVLTGLVCHLGSMIETITPYQEACRQLIALVLQLREESTGDDLRHLSLGGGLAVRYKDETQPLAQQLVSSCSPLLRQHGLSLMLEPGRSIIADAGIVLTRVEYCKIGSVRHFAIVDAAMNDLPRPSLYDSWHEIVATAPSGHETRTWDVVGPVCESGDFIGKDRNLALGAGDLLAVLTTGAYCASMASNYNCRPRAAEVLVDRDQAHLIAARQTMADMLACEIAAKPSV